MARSDETIFFTDLVLEVLEFFRIEFYDLTADVAYHMVVMCMAVSMLVDIAFFGPCYPFDETAFYKKAQSPVD